MSRGRAPLWTRQPCPVCGRVVTVGRSSERIHRHNTDGTLCAGSGQRVDLYGSGPAPEVT